MDNIGKVIQQNAMPIAVKGLQTAFFAGVNAVNTATVLANANKPNLDFNIDGATPDQPEAYSQLGLPVFGRIIFGKGDAGATNEYYDYQGVKGTYTTIVLDGAIVTANFNQQVVKTYVQGRSGSVKEFISSGDMDISISGVFNAPVEQYPEEFISQMAALLSASTTIPVNNKFLNLLGINNIVFVDGCQLPQSIGGYSNQPYTLKAISDTDPDTLYV